MAQFKRIVTQHLWTFLMAAVLTIIPYAGFSAPVLETKQEDCLLNVAMLSDTHIESREVLRRLFLRRGLERLQRSRCAIDAVLIDGDLTNYGDAASMDAHYRIVEECSPVYPVISVYGNHDIGHVEDRPHDEVRADLIARTNAYLGTQFDTIYYALDVAGYRFIVLCDEGERWDYCTLSEAQLAFLDAELAEATADGKPAFVCCHWPVAGTNGEETIWPDSAIDPAAQDVKSVLEKYNNVFFISGHLHAGIKSHAVEERYGLSSAETINGVTYLNLPTFGIVNWFGYPFSGTGAFLEVYADKVLFRPYHYLTGNWFTNSEYTFDLV